MNETAPKDAREVYCDEHGNAIAYCHRDGLAMTDIYRAQFAKANRDDLLRLSDRAKTKSEAMGEQFIVICVDVDDATWRTMVDFLMPGADWQQYRDQGLKPVARGVVNRESIEAIAKEAYPAVFGFDVDSPIAVFSAGGVSVFSADDIRSMEG